QLAITFSKQRIVSSYINLKLIWCGHVCCSKAERVEQQSFCLPHFHKLQLLRKFIRVGSSGKCFLSNDSRSRMLTVTAFARGGKTADNNVGLKFSYHVNNIAQNFFLVPELKGLLRVFRVAEIKSPREKLLGAIHSTRRKQFLRANQSKFFT